MWFPLVSLLVIALTASAQACGVVSTMDDVLGSRNLTGLTAVVTGGASGLGYAACSSLAGHGAAVIIADRNQSQGSIAADEITAKAKAAGGSAQYMHLDLANLTSVHSFAAKFEATGHGDSLRLLINNAGVGGPTSVKTDDGFQLAFEVDYLGHFLLTELLLPHLRMKEGGDVGVLRPTVVNVASDVHLHACETAGWSAGCFSDMTHLPFQALPAMNVTVHYNNVTQSQSNSLYGAAKLLNIQHAAELATREGKNGVLAVAVHPGSCNTGHLPATAWPNICYVTYPQSPCPFTAEQGTAVYAAVLTAETNGGYYSRTTGCGAAGYGCPATACGLSEVKPHGFTPALRAKLYAASLGWVHLT